MDNWLGYCASTDRSKTGIVVVPAAPSAAPAVLLIAGPPDSNKKTGSMCVLFVFVWGWGAGPAGVGAGGGRGGSAHIRVMGKGGGLGVNTNVGGRGNVGYLTHHPHARTVQFPVPCLLHVLPHPGHVYHT